MTKERFFELAKREEVDDEKAMALWEVCPIDTNELTEGEALDAFEKIKSPVMVELFETMRRVGRMFEAHARAMRN